MFAFETSEHNGNNNTGTGLRILTLPIDSISNLDIFIDYGLEFGIQIIWIDIK